MGEWQHLSKVEHHLLGILHPRRFLRVRRTLGDNPLRVIPLRSSLALVVMHNNRQLLRLRKGVAISRNRCPILLDQTYQIKKVCFRECPCVMARQNYQLHQTSRGRLKLS